MPDPLVLAAAWTAGTSAVASVLAWMRVGGRGVRLLMAAATAAGVGLTIALDGLSWGTGLAALGVMIAATWSQAPRMAAAGWLLAAAAASSRITAGISVGIVGDAITAGCITVGLCLGHWFLVDPHLPRGPMRALGSGALIGLILIAIGTFQHGSAVGPLGPMLVWIVVATGAISALALAGALAALNVPTYKGVQSATGLFYICTMSAAGYIILSASLRTSA